MGAVRKPVRYEIAFPGAAEELKDILRGYGRVFRALVRRRPDGSFVLSAGSILAANPNEIRWTARLVLDRGTLRIAADVVTFPWARRRARRLTETRVIQLVDYVETKLRGGAIEKFSEAVSRRPFRAVGPGVSGACVAVASWAAQMCAALAGAFILA
ncbi:MAG: hypothetical protein ACYTAF_05945, partial [Planctomycetota bacterium]